METRKLIDIHVNIPVEVDQKLEEISRFKGEKSYHIVTALKTYLRKWEKRQGKINKQ